MTKDVIPSGAFRVVERTSTMPLVFVNLKTEVGMFIDAPGYNRAAATRGANEATLRALFSELTSGPVEAGADQKIQVTLIGANVAERFKDEAIRNVDTTLELLREISREMPDKVSYDIAIVKGSLLQGRSGYDSASYIPKTGCCEPYTVPYTQPSSATEGVRFSFL